MNLKYISVVFALILSVTLSVEAQTLVVVVNKNNPLSNISSEELRRMFIGDMTTWKAGASVQLADWKFENPLRKKFYQMIMKTSPSAVKRRWLEKVIVGNLFPPSLFSSKEEILEYVSGEEGAIGYMDKKDLDASVKVITVDGESSESDHYKLK